MRETDERVEKLFKEYQERYYISFKDEFYLKELIKLRLQFQDTPLEHIRTKTDLMRLILELDKIIPLRKKDEIKKLFDDYKLLIVGYYPIEYFKHILDGFISDELIEHIKVSSNQIHIRLFTGLIINFISIPQNNYKLDYYRGITCNEYWNLTCDKKIEEWLKTTLIN